MELTAGIGSGRRLLANFDWYALALTLAIAGLGIWNLKSASSTGHGAYWISQLWWLFGGLLAIAFFSFWDYRGLMVLSYPLYGGVLLLLVGVLVKGRTILGARRWLDFGPVRLQPSELAKLAVILVLARYFHDRMPPKGGYRLWDLLVPLALTLVPAALVLKQPDLGTALIIIAVGVTICVFGGIRLVTLGVLGVVAISPLVLIGLIVTAPPGSALAETHMLKKYQRQRVETFLNPEGDALGAGYHANQSMIAVGSGQLTGKGFAQGTQTQLSFLPEQHTDFIFSVWAEEHGFLMCGLVILLYLALVIWALAVGSRARERFGIFCAVGVAALLSWHVFINIGMVSGLLPVVGVTLPLMSYGGSSLLTVLLCVGLLLNVDMRRSGL
jgi:rod shape determining protein RodA